MTRVLGIEGTAWAASAAIFDSARESIRIESEAYQPESGGIHPREAAEHMRSAIPAVIRAVRADEEADIDAVAFSRGPGLGPCLRICGTAARALGQALDVPLVGVNHMVAHLEIGRHQSGFQSPVCLNASGANAHLLGFQNGRYRVLGETMDTGVGNAIDKLARHFGWGHPGGPQVEAAARDGAYFEFPYVVKGMDFSFAGITSAAKDAYDAGVPVEDVCRGVEETVFAMLTEVAERALSLTGSTELVLGGGVGQNARLQGMLETMCEERGAAFFVPADRFLRDNAGMIAVLGAKMLAAGDTVPVAESAVRPDFRPDEVPVTWRTEDAVEPRRSDGREVRGAEAVVELQESDVVKRRVPKTYRHPELDARLRRERTAKEARLLQDARQLGIPTPVVRRIEPESATLVIEYVGETDLGNTVSPAAVGTLGEYLAELHGAGFVHGDPTTRNVRVNGRPYLIDFGLGYYTDDIEDFAMDLHVTRQSLTGTVAAPGELLEALEAGYRQTGDTRVLDQVREIEGRGRYQSSTGADERPPGD